MAGRLAKFLALPAAERAALVRALIWLPLTAAQLRLSGFEAASRSIQAVRAGGRTLEPRVLARLVAIASRHGVVRGNCLSQSLTLQRLLRRQCIASELRIGVRRAGAALEAHAWVELDGRPLNDSADVAQRYAPFDGLASALPPLV
jgi:hypothetical protein